MEQKQRASTLLKITLLGVELGYSIGQSLGMQMIEFSLYYGSSIYFTLSLFFFNIRNFSLLKAN